MGVSVSREGTRRSGPPRKVALGLSAAGGPIPSPHRDKPRAGTWLSKARSRCLALIVPTLRAFADGALGLPLMMRNGRRKHEFLFGYRGQWTESSPVHPDLRAFDDRSAERSSSAKARRSRFMRHCHAQAWRTSFVLLKTDYGRGPEAVLCTTAKPGIMKRARSTTSTRRAATSAGANLWVKISWQRCQRLHPSSDIRRQGAL